MNDDTLLLYYYNDGLSTRERRQVEAAINTDLVVAAQYETLCQQLNAMDDPEPHAVPSHTVQRWHDSIDQAEKQDLVRQRQPSRSFNLFSFAWGAAFAATLAIGVSIGVYFSAAPLTAPTVIAESLATPGAFTRGVSTYFRDTHQELATLPAATAADRTKLVLQIIEQNRLFERAAEQNNSQSLARVLRAFEPILLRLAADDIAPEDAEALRAQLAFELNVMLTKIARDSSNNSQST
jgi:anti-sigma-K factor RskA